MITAVGIVAHKSVYRRLPSIQKSAKYTGENSLLSYSYFLFKLN